MINLSPDMPWEALRVPRAELTRITPEALATAPLVIIEFEGFDGLKPKAQPGECEYRVRIVGETIAQMLGGSYKPEIGNKKLSTGVSEHVDGKAKTYLQLNSSCADKKYDRVKDGVNRAVDFKLKLVGIPHPKTIRDLLRTFDDLDVHDYDQYILVQRPADPSTGQESGIDKEFLSDQIKPFEFITLRETEARVNFGDVAVFFNGIGDPCSRIFATHTTNVVVSDEQSGEWRTTTSLSRSVALGRVTLPVEY